MTAIYVALFAAILVSGCVAPISKPKPDITPEFRGKPTATIGIAVVDFRTFILNGNKEEWFEGIFRDVWGIPSSYSRIDEFKEKPFAYYLSSKLKRSMDNAGSNATVVTVSKGTPFPKVIDELRKIGVDSSLVVLMYQSRYDFGRTKPTYEYHFDLLVLDRKLKTLVHKSFRRFHQNMESSKQLSHDMDFSEDHELFDYTTSLYKEMFETFLNDPKISGALNAAAGK